MASSKSVFFPIGGGELSECEDILDAIFDYMGTRDDAHMVIMTVATSDEESAATKYNSVFRKRTISHVEVVNVNDRQDAFDEGSVEKIKRADGIFFTGGDQNNIPSLLGGSALHIAMKERIGAGVLIVGTSAGAAMMSGTMISGGESKTAPRVGAVRIAPGMNIVKDTIIDTHFSERGRHGRLMTAIAHDPQLLGIGLDEQTGIYITGKEFKVVGKGSVLVVDGNKISYSNLVYRKENEPIAMFGTCIHVLPSGYSYDIEARQPKIPKSKSATS